MPPPSRPALLLALVLSALVLLSAVAGATISLLNQPKPAWFALAFELTIIVAAAMGCLVGLGRFRQGPALALLCVAGSVAVGSLLGYVGDGRRLLGLNMMPSLAARELAAGLLLASAAWLVLARDPTRTLPPLVKGLALGVLALAAAGGLWAARAGLASIPDAVKLFLIVVLFLVFTVLVSISAHLVILAFQRGGVPKPPSGRGLGSPRMPDE